MTAPGAAPLLSIEAVAKHFGGVVALEDVSFLVEASTILGLIGPNGSGKTTLLNVINGVFAPDRGAVRLAGARIDGRRSCDLAAAGLNRTFQSARVFRTLTVRQNLFIPLLHQGAVARTAAIERAAE
jgi:branched-chain amino acid transport system ATP-binding protein